MPLSITDFLLLRHDHPVVDVRSEGEFEAGCVRGAINVPLLNNEARVIVGTAYKQKGQEEAIKEGFRLVGPRLADILDETKKNLLTNCFFSIFVWLILLHYVRIYKGKNC